MKNESIYNADILRSVARKLVIENIKDISKGELTRAFSETVAPNICMRVAEYLIGIGLTFQNLLDFTKDGFIENLLLDTQLRLDLL